ncbi:MAG: hypothetical protein AAB284_06790, partial [Chloroflexota bacterium]
MDREEVVRRGHGLDAQEHVGRVRAVEREVHGKLDRAGAGNEGVEAVAEDVILAVGVPAPAGVGVGVGAVAEAAGVALLATAAESAPVAGRVALERGAVAGDVEGAELTEEAELGDGDGDGDGDGNGNGNGEARRSRAMRTAL